MAKIYHIFCYKNVNQFPTDLWVDHHKSGHVYFLRAILSQQLVDGIETDLLGLYERN